MKAARILITIAWLAIAGHALADDFTIADFSLDPGETKTISIELNNPTNSYIAFEFYMTLPEGFTIPEDEDGYLMAELNSTRINRHVLEVSQMPDGSYHFLCYSNRNSLLKGTSGEMIAMTVKAADDIAAGTYRGNVFTQKLSDPDENKVTFDDFTFHITVAAPAPEPGHCPHGCLLGDMNQDGSISIADVMEIVKIIVGQ